MKQVALVLVCIFIILSGGSAVMHVQPVETLQPVEQRALPVLAAAPSVQPSLPTSSHQPSAYTYEAPSSRISTVDILAVGDLMCLYAQLNAARSHGTYNFDPSFSKVKDMISSADLAIGNLETPVASGYKYTGPSPDKGSPKLNAPESYLAALKNCGFDLLTTANNHAWDKKADGVIKTISKLDEYGFAHTGTNSDGTHMPPAIFIAKGISIAVLSYTSHVNGSPKTYGMVNRYNEQQITDDIALAKEKGADYVIVYMHWGKERTHKVSSTQKKQAAFIANAGADLILGSHPHCTQGAAFIETDHGKVPVFYSLGNFVSSMGATICRDSIMVNIRLEKKFVTGNTVLTGLTYTPVYCKGRYVVYPADEESIAQSNSKSLKSSRSRTIKVLGDKVASPN